MKHRVKRSQVIGFRLLEKEYEELRKAAEKLELSPGEWARVQLLKLLEGLPAGNISDSERVVLEEILALRSIFLTLLKHNGFSVEQLQQISSRVDAQKSQILNAMLQKRQDQQPINNQ